LRQDILCEKMNRFSCKR